MRCSTLQGCLFYFKYWQPSWIWPFCKRKKANSRELSSFWYYFHWPAAWKLHWKRRREDKHTWSVGYCFGRNGLHVGEHRFMVWPTYRAFKEPEAAAEAAFGSSSSLLCRSKGDTKTKASSTNTQGTDHKTIEYRLATRKAHITRWCIKR